MKDQFAKHGCHLCGSKTGTAVLDHIPPIGHNPNKLPFQGFPSCTKCSFPKQANAVKAAKNYPISQVPITPPGNRPVTGRAGGAAAAAQLVQMAASSTSNFSLDTQNQKALGHCAEQSKNRTSAINCGCCFVTITRISSPDGFINWYKDGSGSFHDKPCYEVPNQTYYLAEGTGIYENKVSY